jgi:hypothetical protein
MHATVAGDTIRFDYFDGDTILATVLMIRGEQMTVTFRAKSGRIAPMCRGYPAPTPQFQNDWWPVAAGAAAANSAAEPAAAKHSKSRLIADCFLREHAEERGNRRGALSFGT